MKFETLNSVAIPFPKKNVDTDFIIRIERCAGVPREEVGQYAFEMARADPEFVFNQPRYRGAQIIVAGENFGTGSSREHAVWALQGIGIRCIIASLYGRLPGCKCFDVHAGRARAVAVLYPAYGAGIRLRP